MSLFDYEASRRITSLDGMSFYGVLMAAMRLADSKNLAILQDGWPHIWDELLARYNAAGGRLDDDPFPAETLRR